MNGKTFARYLERDGGCLHCGEREAVAPNHRANRGMGGSKSDLINAPSNCVVLCSVLNGLLESDDRWHRLAVDMGWKLSKWDDPKTKPVYDYQTACWFLLGDDYSRMVVNQERSTNADSSHETQF